VVPGDGHLLSGEKVLTVTRGAAALRQPEIGSSTEARDLTSAERRSFSTDFEDH